MKNITKEKLIASEEKAVKWLKEHKVLSRILEIFAAMIIGSLALEADNLAVKAGGVAVGGLLYIDALLREVVRPSSLNKE